MVRRWVGDLAVVAGYVALTLFFTYPLVAQFTTHVPGTNVDDLAFVWNIWWFKHAIFDLGTDPFSTNLIFYPVGVDMAFYTLAVLNDLLALPFVGVVGLVAASNLVLVFAFTMSAYGTYLLLRYLLADVPAVRGVRLAAAFVGGVVFAFAPSRFVYASLGHYNVVSAEWMPFYVLFFIRMLRGLQAERDGRRPGSAPGRDAVAAGLFLSLALLVDLGYGFFLLFISLLLLAFTTRTVVFSVSFVRRAVLLALAALVPFSPVLFFMVRELRRGQGLNFPGWGYADMLSADLVGLVTPTRFHPLWGEATREIQARFTDVNTVFIGYAVPLLALVAAVVYGRRLAVWSVGALASVVLALGPVLHINGQYVFDLDGLVVTVPLPYIILHYIPVLNMNRAPNRFSLPLSLCFAVLVAYAVVWLLPKARGVVWRGLLFAGVCVVVGIESLSIPLPMSDARVPMAYARIAEEPGDFAILPLPLGWRESFRTMGAEQTNVQYYQVVHGKRLINGNGTRVPVFKFSYYDRIGLIKSIVDEEMYQPVDEARRQRDRDSAAEVMYFFDIRYVVCNPATPGRLPYADTITRTQDYVRSVLPLEPAFVQDGITVYRVVQPPPKTEVVIDLGTPGAKLYQGEGWGEDETGPNGLTYNWATAQGTRVFVPLRVMGDYRLRLTMQPFAYAGGPQQTVTVRVNGRSLPDRLTLAPAWAPYEVTIPASFLKAGLNEVAFDFAYVASPRQVLPADYAIGLTGARSPMEITVQTAAGFASVKLDDREVSLGAVGYNLVVLDERDGRVLAARAFDAMASVEQAQALADFVASLPNGRIVAVSARGQTGGSLPAVAATALASLGLGGDTSVPPGKVLAAVGVKGAGPGQALQQMVSGLAYVHLGPNSDRRTLAVAVDSVSVMKVGP